MLKPEEFTEAFWQIIEPHLEALEDGGIMLVSVEVLRSQNHPRVSFGTFSAKQRAALRKALLKSLNKK